MKTTPGVHNQPYPIWYFFYGTLTKPSILRHVLDIEEQPIFRPAKITGYELSSWGQYLALIDGAKDARVTGCAYQVQTLEHDEKLARYETDAYKVHRCMIEFTDGNEPVEVYGNTFIYAGDAKALVEGRFDRRLWQIRMGVALPKAWNIELEGQKPE
ncbi:hypothetical protein O1611_g3462 [Lasiodiplodia mahajangana]|uniref:Uncharacterized protein n=1 Tax=Lasiodiplodia mahajangana TaxID=1108764 RepID=A0ACC2JRW3_9PEZI|nr:hypothetical protein O1611_g3462 [Lasiodiplodia mahajangana]